MSHDLENIHKDLHSPSKEKRFKALQTIRKQKLQEIVPELQLLYDRERNLDIQREILKAFADVGGGQAIEGLINALQSHVADLRLEAARRLSRLNVPAAKRVFLHHLEGEEWDLIRLILDTFLPPYGTAQDIPSLLSVVQRAPNATIKYLATRVINAIQQNKRTT